MYQAFKGDGDALKGNEEASRVTAREALNGDGDREVLKDDWETLKGVREAL